MNDDAATNPYIDVIVEEPEKKFNNGLAWVAIGLSAIAILLVLINFAFEGKWIDAKVDEAIIAAQEGDNALATQKWVEDRGFASTSDVDGKITAHESTRHSSDAETAAVAKPTAKTTTTEGGEAAATKPAATDGGDTTPAPAPAITPRKARRL